MGASAALYSVTCFTHGRYGNGSRHPINLSAVIALIGWLPCSRSLKIKVENSQDAARRAASFPLPLCHGRGPAGLALGTISNEVSDQNSNHASIFLYAAWVSKPHVQGLQWT